MAGARLEVRGRPTRRRRGGAVPPRGQPGRAAPAAGPGGVGRRAGPGDAGAAPGRRPAARRPWSSTRWTPASAGGRPGPGAGRCARWRRDRQVLVVTHLAQVAAFADHQVAVRKVEQRRPDGDRRRRSRTPSRVVELSRMLSGHPDSATARAHAEELLALGRRPRVPAGGSAGSAPAARRRLACEGAPAMRDRRR